MERKIGPRFHNKTKIPEVPKGMQLVKFYGQPALIPAKEENAVMYGNTGFTNQQVEALIKLDRERNIRELMKNLDDYPYPAQYVICKIYESAIS